MSVARIPLAFRLGLPELEAQIGQERVSLLLDSGAAPALALHAGVLHLPGVAIRDEVTSYGDALGRCFTARRFDVERFTVGARTFTGLAGVESVFPPDFAPPNRNGFVGRELFEGQRLLFDYPAGVLTIFEGAIGEEEATLRREGAAADLEVERDGWVLHGTLAGSPVRMVLDTCSTHSLLRSDEEGSVVCDFVAGAVRRSELELVKVPLRGPAVDGILGANFFGGRRILVDVGARRLWDTRALVASSRAE